MESEQDYLNQVQFAVVVCAVLMLAALVTGILIILATV